MAEGELAAARIGIGRADEIENDSTFRQALAKELGQGLRFLVQPVHADFCNKIDTDF